MSSSRCGTRRGVKRRKLDKAPVEEVVDEDEEIPNDDDEQNGGATDCAQLTITQGNEDENESDDDGEDMKELEVPAIPDNLNNLLAKRKPGRPRANQAKKLYSCPFSINRQKPCNKFILGTKRSRVYLSCVLPEADC